ncbi:MAG: DUF3592 domain-containing protein [Sphingomonadaceae bacterium]|nr:DUF3592 domain-containing protein [Sphingomonadaceae bacterium]
MTTLETIAHKHKANVLAMGGTVELARVNRAPRHDGSYHVEPARDGGWLLIVTERGREWERTHFADNDALLYRLARDAASRLAGQYELANRVGAQDSRRIWFARKLELIGLLSDDWRERLAAEIDGILAQAPYDDEPLEVLSAPHPARDWLVGGSVVAMLLLGWALAHLPLWFAYDLERDLDARGVPLEASVISSTSSRPKIGTTYHLQYAYDVAGKLFETREVVSETIGKGFAAGDTLPIRYDPDEPERSLVDGNMRFARLVTIYSGIDALLAFVILGGLWGWWRRRNL